jgi:hypothetical protein
MRLKTAPLFLRRSRAITIFTACFKSRPPPRTPNRIRPAPPRTPPRQQHRIVQRHRSPLREAAPLSTTADAAV